MLLSFCNITFSRALCFSPEVPGTGGVPPGLPGMLVWFPLTFSALLLPLWSVPAVFFHVLASPHRRKCRSNSTCCSPLTSSSPLTKPSWAPLSGPASWWMRLTGSRTTSPR